VIRDPLSVIRGFADDEHALTLRRFFKTGPGEYGEGDRFLGLRVPQVRKVAQEFRALPLADVAGLLKSEWHEVRLLALIILVDQYQRGDPKAREALYRLYLANTARINNWDLVDTSAPYIVGAHLANRSRAPIRRLARSHSLWERRIAILATFHFIQNDDFDDAIAIVTMLLHDRHDLIHKAAGWALREVGKRDRTVLRAFLDEHASEMPRTMLRYAIEHFDPHSRQKYLLGSRITDHG
jgi:3-methyladenine DNA glycosylase AlkD